MSLWVQLCLFCTWSIEGKNGNYLNNPGVWYINALFRASFPIMRLQLFYRHITALLRTSATKSTEPSSRIWSTPLYGEHQSNISLKELAKIMFLMMRMLFRLSREWNKWKYFLFLHDTGNKGTAIKSKCCNGNKCRYFWYFALLLKVGCTVRNF